MINTKVILDTVQTQKEKNLAQTKNYIVRNTDTSKITPLPKFARIVTGIRRCGKSSLIQMILQNTQSFYLNFEDTALYGFSSSDFLILDDALDAYLKENKKCKYLCFDEIQSIKGWEVYVHQKLNEGFLVIITGSNASLLSKELGTRLTGRHLDFELFPFSFTEFCVFSNLKPTDKAFEKYLQKGGFPEFLKLGDGEILQRLFDDILVRDIAIRHSLKDIRTLRVLSLYLASNCGNLITGTKLSAQLGLKTNVTILEYLSYLEQSYLFFFVQKFDYSAKAQSINPKKVYSIDTGLINNVTLSTSKDLGRLLENAVFLELRRKTKNIWYYAEQSFECDFLYGKNIVPEKAIQVCFELTNENREREVKGLVETCKKFNNLEPLIVTFSQKDKISYGNMIVPVVPASEFFQNLEKQK